MTFDEPLGDVRNSISANLRHAARELFRQRLRFLLMSPTMGTILEVDVAHKLSILGEDLAVLEPLESDYEGTAAQRWEDFIAAGWWPSSVDNFAMKFVTK